MDKIKEVEVEIFENLKETKGFGDLKQKYEVSHFDKFIDMATNDATKKFIKKLIKNLIYDNLATKENKVI